MWMYGGYPQIASKIEPFEAPRSVLGSHDYVSLKARSVLNMAA